MAALSILQEGFLARKNSCVTAYFLTTACKCAPSVFEGTVEHEK